MQPPPIPPDWIAAARVWRWYSTRLRKGAAPVACELVIISHRDATGRLTCDERVIATVDGVDEDVTATPPRGWPWRAIPEAEHRYLSETAAWARAHAPHLPQANPTRRLTIADAALPF